MKEQPVKTEEKDKEIAELREWKRQAIEVMPDMQAIGKELNIPLGQSVHDRILPEIKRLKALIKSLYVMYNRDAMFPHQLENYYKQFASENNL